MKKVIVLMLAVMMVLTVVGCAKNEPAPADGDKVVVAPEGDAETPEASDTGEVKRIAIGTAGTAGSLYPMGVGMAQVITDNVEGIQATGEATAASLENLRNLHEGIMEWGIAATEIADLAYNGSGDFAENKMDDIRSLFSTIYQYVQAFVPADSAIATIADMEGKTIGVGAAGSGGEMAARMILAYYGLDYTKVNAQFIPEKDAVAALKDGKIDGFICTHPLKSSVLLDLTTSSDVKMISIADDDFYSSHPFYTKYEVAANTYEGIDEAVYTPRSRIVMYTSTNAGFSDEEVYEMVKAVWEKAAEWKTASKSVETQCNIETALDEITVPLHPGAVKYFEEIGMEIPEGLK